MTKKDELEMKDNLMASVSLCKIGFIQQWQGAAESNPLSICQDSHGSSYKICFSVPDYHDLEGREDEVQ